MTDVVSNDAQSILHEHKEAFSSFCTASEDVAVPEYGTEEALLSFNSPFPRAASRSTTSYDTVRNASPRRLHLRIVG
jgi:hypothetical protein